MYSVMELAEKEAGVCLKKIALATDFSDASEKAVDCAVGIARSYGAQLYLVHAIHSEPGLLPDLPSHDQQQTESERKMDELSQRISSRELTLQPVLRPGPVGKVLSELIHHENIDLLVLGTHGRGGMKKLVLGSVAEELVRSAHCPVITVGPHAAESAGSAGEFRRIIFAAGFGAASTRALSYAQFLAERSETKLILLHVLPPTPFPSAGVGLRAYARIEEWRREETATIRAKLQRMLPSDAGLECQPEYVVGFDLLFHGILAAATEQRADLIVMGAKAPIFSKAMAHVPWTVAHEVLCHAQCPVMTVRA